ncbi:hypothetical protein JOC78_002207 [Bacillus ectoiniformans]|uniref:hypothetical protein n=1 Tax=Bacillus ectoiniformans TaxID=1494429 RepID=UPI00195D6EED|nr:hypothetical protein [Bacillus ectoiniformans]MBM7649254.1 hypothetical protein [Bacillus ectoiniformans]
MKRLKYVIPIMILVFILATNKLEKDYSVIDSQTRMLISAGAAIVSGVISYFLLGNDDPEDTIDPPLKNK